MKRLILTLLSTAAAVTLAAQPDSLDYRGDYYFSKRSQQESLPVRPHHTVMLGNSLTERGAWAEYFPEAHVINRGIGGDVVHPDPGGADFRRFGLADVEQQAGRAHGRERARGHHVDFTGGFFRAHAPDGLDHFLGVEDYGLAFFDALVDFRNCLDNLVRRHDSFPRQMVGSLGGRGLVCFSFFVFSK